MRRQRVAVTRQSAGNGVNGGHAEHAVGAEQRHEALPTVPSRPAFVRDRIASRSRRGASIEFAAAALRPRRRALAARESDRLPRAWGIGGPLVRQPVRLVQ